MELFSIRIQRTFQLVSTHGNVGSKAGRCTQDCQPMKSCYRQITARCDLWHTNLFSVPQNTLGKFTPKSFANERKRFPN